MARGSLTALSTDLQSDSGSVLWSLVRGEQLEFPIKLNFLENASIGYSFEAVVIEVLNVPGQSGKPDTIRASGVQDVLTVWTPPINAAGLAWSAASVSYAVDTLIKFANL